jgi:hypothetical protein
MRREDLHEKIDQIHGSCILDGHKRINKIVVIVIIESHSVFLNDRLTKSVVCGLCLLNGYLTVGEESRFFIIISLTVS